MRQLLEQSLLGLFPGSKTDDYFNEDMRADLDKLDIGAISSVTCIADYKQDKDSFENKNFIQGLEKFIYSMQGKAFTAICIANNLQYLLSIFLRIHLCQRQKQVSYGVSSKRLHIFHTSCTHWFMKLSRYNRRHRLHFG